MKFKHHRVLSNQNIDKPSDFESFKKNLEDSLENLGEKQEPRLEKKNSEQLFQRV